MEFPVLNHEKLVLFRDLKIGLSELTGSGRLSMLDISKAKADTGENIIIDKEHVLNLLIKFKSKELTEDQVLDWVRVVKNTDTLLVSEEDEQKHDSILSVIDNLWLIEMGLKINDSDIDRYIESLKNNKVVAFEIDRVKLHKDYKDYYKDKGYFIFSISPGKKPPKT